MDMDRMLPSCLRSTNTQSSALSSPPSNIHHGDIDDKGNIDHGSGHNIASGDADGAQIHITQNFPQVPKAVAEDGNKLDNLLYRMTLSTTPKLYQPSAIPAYAKPPATL
ncbi:hypothetical protein M378DRAFT_10230 [Amanita muscaria Koide BX008]|uniref:Uncharacterized protein n=1 Tax=Amanita muscaria (strain Koide BX008) TaxID=946122 RepID=A0A0C2SSD3_AMAMK|nr:hypothetical protein M378DRAFT_10230 [Amanita muscaria Koide BX008]